MLSSRNKGSDLFFVLVKLTCNSIKTTFLINKKMCLLFVFLFAFQEALKGLGKHIFYFCSFSIKVMDSHF